MSAKDRLHRTDTIRSDDILRLAAALDLPAPATGLVPPLWHWTSFLDRTLTEQMGADGHPRAGGLVEYPPHPRRMFAGARLTWARTLPTDVPLTRVVEVSEPVHKESSRTGPMVFVTILMRYLADGEELAQEQQDLAYLPERPPPSADAPAPSESAPDEAEHEDAASDGVLLRRRAAFGPVVLFRFSALTYNSHRIHYDQPYVTGVEGYPGLVVHGPLLAMQLAELARALHGDAALEGFAFRARSPAFAGERIVLEAREASIDDAEAAPGTAGGRVLALTARRGTTELMTASARLRPGL